MRVKVAWGFSCSIRLQQIVVDADHRRSRAGYTKEERAFRNRIEINLAQMQARGETLDYSSDGLGWELPDIGDLAEPDLD